VHQKFVALGMAAFFIDHLGQLRVVGYKAVAVDESTDTMVFTRQQTEDIEGVLVNSIRKHLAIKEVRGKEEVKEAGKTT
jgi:RecA/RadA recombinase